MFPDLTRHPKRAYLFGEARGDVGVPVFAQLVFEMHPSLLKVKLLRAEYTMS